MSQELRDQIVDEVCVGATPEQATRARKVARQQGNLAEQLQNVGIAGQDVLQACCAVTGLPPTPQAWLRQPRLASVPGLDLQLCRRLGAVPLLGTGGRLCMVFHDPELGADSQALGLPPHHAYLALAADLARAAELLPPAEIDDIPPTTVGPGAARTNPEPRPSERGAAASADPLDLVPPDGATVQMATVPPHDEPDDADGSEDGPLFDDPTSAVPAFTLPSAPKPAARQQHETVSGVAQAARVADPDDLDDVATERVQARPQSRRLPSLATPAEGTVNDDLAAKPTLVSDPPRVPRPPPSARPSPSGKRPAAPTVAAAAATPSKPAAPAKPVTPSRPATPQRPLVVDDAAPTEFTPPANRRPGAAAVTSPEAPASPETQQRALAALSAEDLLDDEELSSASADEMPLELDYDKVPPKPRPPPPVDGASTVYGAPTEPPEESADQGAGDDGFASAANAEDQGNVAQQKNRMKRIAQIAAIKRYKMERVLGRGGMATVYLATDTRTGRPCALKLMEPHLAEDEVFVERFKREIKASISLSHENIVGVFDFGEENGTYYMASEYVDAGTVAALLKAIDKPLPPALAVPIMMGFLDGLGAAHAQGFVHRDLKPANLMLTSNGVVKIGDFGIAKAQTDSTLTKTGALFGTPAYMSPEQATGQELDGRSDLFAAGIIFYELLAGYNPYAHENPSTTMFAIARGQARPIFDANPTIPGAAEKVVMRLLEKDRAKRYQTAAEAREDLMVLADLLAKKHPGAVAAATRNAVAAADELSKAQAAMEVERAQKLMQKVPPESAEACFRYYKATLLDPSSFDAMNGLTQLRGEFGFRFTRPDDKQLLELEAALEKKPDQPAVLRRLADLSASHRNLVDMAGFAKRYLRYQPGDTHMQGRLERVIGTDPLAPFSRMALDNAAKVAQQAVAASDDMRDAARAAAEEEALAARAAGVKPSLRPAARAAAQPAAASSRDIPSNPPTPGTLELDDVGPRKSRHAAAAASLAAGGEVAAAVPAKPPEPPPPEPEVELPPPRDSFEATVRMLRQAWRDTVRSLTGDRGVKYVKEELKSRLEEGRREAKEAAKVALKASKEAVKQNVLDEKGRKALQQEMKEKGRVGLRRHWRLAVVILIAWGLLIGAGKACHMLCSSEEPAATPPPSPKAPTTESAKRPSSSPKGTERAAAAASNAGDEPAGEDAKAPEGADVAAEAAAPPPEAATPPAAAAPPAAAPAAGGMDLARRQDELRQRAKNEEDTQRAIELYTKAIDVDPYARGARDALVERARLLLAEGDLERAERDLFALKRRSDVDAVKGDIEQMLADLESAKKAAEAPPPPDP